MSDYDTLSSNVADALKKAYASGRRFFAFFIVVARRANAPWSRYRQARWKELFTATYDLFMSEAKEDDNALAKLAHAWERARLDRKIAAVAATKGIPDEAWVGKKQAEMPAVLRSIHVHYTQYNNMPFIVATSHGFFYRTEMHLLRALVMSAEHALLESTGGTKMKFRIMQHLSRAGGLRKMKHSVARKRDEALKLAESKWALFKKHISMFRRDNEVKTQVDFGDLTQASFGGEFLQEFPLGKTSKELSWPGRRDLKQHLLYLQSKTQKVVSERHRQRVAWSAEKKSLFPEFLPTNKAEVLEVLARQKKWMDAHSDSYEEDYSGPSLVDTRHASKAISRTMKQCGVPHVRGDAYRFLFKGVAGITSEMLSFGSDTGPFVPGRDDANEVENVRQLLYLPVSNLGSRADDLKTSIQAAYNVMSSSPHRKDELAVLFPEDEHAVSRRGLDEEFYDEHGEYAFREETLVVPRLHDTEALVATLEKLKRAREKREREKQDETTSESEESTSSSEESDVTPRRRRVVVLVSSSDDASPRSHVKRKHVSSDDEDMRSSSARPSVLKRARTDLDNIDLSELLSGGEEDVVMAPSAQVVVLSSSSDEDTHPRTNLDDLNLSELLPAGDEDVVMASSEVHTESLVLSDSDSDDAYERRRYERRQRRGRRSAMRSPRGTRSINVIAPVFTNLTSNDERDNTVGGCVHKKFVSAYLRIFPTV